MLGAGGAACIDVCRGGGGTLIITGTETTVWGFLQQSLGRCREEIGGYQGALLGPSRMHSPITSREEAPGRSHS